MSFLLHIRQFFHTVSDKYYVELTETDGAKPVPTGIAHKYVKYDDKTGETDFVSSPKDATCFDFVLGFQVANAIKKVVQDPKIQVGLISLGDANFIHEIMGTNSRATQAALTPSEKKELDRAAEYAKELFDLLKRIPGVHGAAPVTEIGQSNRISAVEIYVNDIAAKAAVYAFHVGTKNLIDRDDNAKASYNGLPVRIIVTKAPTVKSTP